MGLDQSNISTLHYLQHNSRLRAQEKYRIILIYPILNLAPIPSAIIHWQIKCRIKKHLKKEYATNCVIKISKTF